MDNDISSPFPILDIVFFAASDTLELPHDSANLRSYEVSQSQMAAHVASIQSAEKGQRQRKQI